MDPTSQPDPPPPGPVPPSPTPPGSVPPGAGPPGTAPPAPWPGTAPPGVAAVGQPGPYPAPARYPVGLLVLVVLLGVGTLASLCVGGVALVGARSTSPQRYAGPWPNPEVTPAVRAAKECVTGFMSVSEDTVSGDLERVLDCATGEFERQYRTGLDDVRASVVDNDVRATARVLEAAVVAADSRSAELLLAVDATTRSTRTPEGREVHYRVLVQMSRVRTQWKVGELVLFS